VKTKTVSDSEVYVFQMCERRHMFAYGYNLQPKKTDQVLRIGSIGHELIGEYYKAKQNNATPDECYQAGMLYLAKNYMGVNYDDSIKIVAARFADFTEYHRYDDFRVVAVEEMFKCMLSPDIQYVFVPDLVVEKPNGRMRVYEWKWSYNFWTLDEVHRSAQLPKYIKGLRILGYDVEDGILGQIRTRPIANPQMSQLLRDSPYTPYDVRLDNIMQVQLNIARRIRDLPSKEIWKDKAQPTISKQNCRGCPFGVPCDQMLDGNNPLTTLQTFYEFRDRPAHND
jgi:PD-(D/E)XK nuclease superfamily protein